MGLLRKKKKTEKVPEVPTNVVEVAPVAPAPVAPTPALVPVEAPMMKQQIPDVPVAPVAVEEEVVEEEDDEVEERRVVVKELPTQVVRSYVDEQGVLVRLITTEEYLTELANSD